MLCVADVLSIKANRAAQNRQVYKKLLERCNNKILMAALRSQTSTSHYIRPIEPGTPLINTKNAFNYIKDKLTKGGFVVDHVHAAGTYLITVSWEVDRVAILRQLADHCDRPSQSNVIF
jgi:hypothetical protein